MNKKRLLKMADFVETIPRKDFDMAFYMNECGTVGCALGHAAHAKIFRTLRMNRYNIPTCGEYLRGSAAAAELFEIKQSEAFGLFHWHSAHNTPKRVANNIRRFVETGKLP